MSSGKRLSPRDRILECALREFSQSGYYGARVARITRAARVNPRMLFYYFKSKAKLFNAVQESIWKRNGLSESGAAPKEPVDSLGEWYRFYCENPEWARILLWEGLEGRKIDSREATQRRAIWKTNLKKMADIRRPDGWPKSMDLPHLLLSLLAMQLAPMALPHQAQMITGKNPISSEFIRDRQKFLNEFVKMITCASPAAKPRKAKPPKVSTRRVATGSVQK